MLASGARSQGFKSSRARHVIRVLNFNSIDLVNDHLSVLFSKATAKREILVDLIAFETVDEALSDDFCTWFSGWTDGLGNFEIFSNQTSFSFVYKTSVAQADLATLEYIQSQLKCGDITRTKPVKEGKVAYQFKVSDTKGIAKLIAVLEAYPLKTASKYLQFSLWQKAFYLDGRHDEKDAGDQETMSNLIHQLKLAKEEAKRLPQDPTREKHKDISGNQLSLFE